MGCACCAGCEDKKSRFSGDYDYEERERNSINCSLARTIEVQTDIKNLDIFLDVNPTSEDEEELNEKKLYWYEN